MMKRLRRLLSVSALLASVVLLSLSAAAHASQNAAAGSPSPSPSPKHAAKAADSSPQPSPSPSASSSPEGHIFYNMQGNINSYDNVDRNATLYYYFQGNTDGTAKVKRELRYGRTLWNNSAVAGIRIPFITKYPLMGNPYTGLGNIELGVSYNATSPDYYHSIEMRVSLPTAVNNVSSNDTQLKAFYTSKWKFKGGSFIYANEYDQSIIVPPGSSWTSYYEGKLSGPNTAFRIAPGIQFAGIYNFRTLFDTNGLYKQAAGGTIFGNFNDVALSVTDTWGGTSVNSLWKYKFEFNLTAKF